MLIKYDLEPQTAAAFTQRFVKQFPHKVTPTVFKDSILVIDLMKVYQYGFGK